MKKTVLMFLIVSCLLLTGCTGVLRARELYNKGNYREVVAIFQDMKDPTTVDLYNLANIKIFEEDIVSAIENTDINKFVKTVCDYQSVYGDKNIMDELDAIAIDSVNKLLTELTEYEDFVYAENIVDELKNEGYDGNILPGIENILKEKKLDKLKLALTGTWTRNDHTWLSGSKIDVVFSETSGKAVLKYAVSNSFGYQNGDVKWKDIELYSDTNFSFNDLSKNHFGLDYIPANATIDYSTMTVSVHVSETFSSETDQVWIKDQYMNVSNIERSGNKTSVHSDDYLYPSNIQYISESELNGFSENKIALIRNEIYARHGYVFKKEPYKTYFSSKNWYIPNVNFSENMFNEFEKYNKNLIVEYEKRQGWR